MSKRTMKACGAEVPHGEHGWQSEEQTVRCPGRDTGDTTGLNAEPCGNTAPHASHLWEKRGYMVRRCFGAYGPEMAGEPQSAKVVYFDRPEGGRPVEMVSGPDGALWGPKPTLWAEGAHMSNHPGRNCGRTETHQVHDWSDADGTYFCYGDAFDPEATLHEGNQSTREVVRWADRAMFKAEPIQPEEGPKVYLLWMTPDPLGAVAAACKMYKGEVVRDLRDITDAERIEYFEQVQNTKLKAPFEFVKFHFMIEGVTRSFTHQMVRQRTAVYAQESLRFAVVGEESGDIPVRLPPSLSGLPEDDPQRRDWEDANAMIGNVYRRLVDNGVPAEDARGLLPHNVLTRLHYSTDLRALLDHAGNRLCTQAQFEWRLVFAKIVEAIRNAENAMSGPVDVVGSPGYAKMARDLASLFKPVCYQTGKCEFKANFDRACSIRDRVDANAAIGRPSSEWDKGHGDPDINHGGLRIMPIKPGEWLMDHTAARRT